MEELRSLSPGTIRKLLREAMQENKFWNGVDWVSRLSEADISKHLNEAEEMGKKQAQEDAKSTSPAPATSTSASTAIASYTNDAAKAIMTKPATSAASAAASPAITREAQKELCKLMFLNEFTTNLTIPREHIESCEADIAVMANHLLGDRYDRGMLGEFAHLVGIRRKEMEAKAREFGVIIKLPDGPEKEKATADFKTSLKEASTFEEELVYSVAESFDKYPQWCNTLVVRASATVYMGVKLHFPPDVIMDIEREMFVLVGFFRDSAVFGVDIARLLVEGIEKRYDQIASQARTAIVMHEDNLSKGDREKMDAEVIHSMNGNH
jgi:hypothetical protein